MTSPDINLSLQQLERILQSMPPDEFERAVEATRDIRQAIWTPLHGPQTEAYYSEADELLYGGAAGGGKTDLLCGLALTSHQRSLLFRRQSTDLDGLWDRLVELADRRILNSNMNKKTLKLRDGRTIEGGHLEKPGSEKSWQGRPHDFIGYDEVAQLPEYKVAFTAQWLRTTKPDQRVRLVMATNPPLPEYKNGRILDVSTGAWLKAWFAPWLDDMYDNPAKSGELRWCYMITAGDRFITHWVPGPGLYYRSTGEPVPDGEHEDPRFMVRAKSRTFVRSRLQDNIHLSESDYADRLNSSPEPLRTLLLEGDFNVKLEDHPMQVIPTGWVLEAQQRWYERQHEVEQLKQLVVAADIAQGGADTTVIASLLDTEFFEELLVQPGRETPTGIEVAQMLLRARRNNSMVVLDGTGGWGGATRDMLRTHHNIKAMLSVASRGVVDRTPDMQYKFKNERTAMWMTMRYALDPDSVHKICLPPNTRLLSQLTTPHHAYEGKEVAVESKIEVVKRTEGSTDEADAIIMAWYYRKAALALRLSAGADDPHATRGIQDLRNHPYTQKNVNTQTELYNPLRSR